MESASMAIATYWVAAGQELIQHLITLQTFIRLTGSTNIPAQTAIFEYQNCCTLKAVDFNLKWISTMYQEFNVDSERTVTWCYTQSKIPFA